MNVVPCGPVALAIVALAFASVAAGQESCKLAPIGNFGVAGIRDGRTLVLADGRELRLAGIATGDAGRAALEALAAGQMLRLEKLQVENDRYGRLVAFAYAGEMQTSLQQAMIEQGQARVSSRVGDSVCAEVLLAAERRITAVRGQFALVEGKVLSVRESGSTIYLNFGRRWAQDFTVTILKRNRRAFAVAGIDPGRLEGQSIRVRGWIEQRTGPMIEAVTPEQIEFADRK